MFKELNKKTKALVKSELEKKAKVKEVKHYMDKSSKDSLTSLYNRGKVDEALYILYDEYKRTNKIFSIIFVDIDHFKTINDTFGHSKGDEVLIQIATMLKNKTREDDFVGRYGGEEFIIMIEGSIEKASILAEKIRSSVEHTTFSIDRKVTCSLGVTMINDKDTLETILQRSDKALYKAKESDRNKVIVLN